MRLLRLFIAALAFAALGSLAQGAHAQVQTLVRGNPSWNGRSETNRKAEEISLQDCLDDATITFTTTPNGVTTGSFELWAGSGCDDAMSRTTGTSCLLAGTGSLTAREVTVRVQNLVKTFAETGEGTDDTCTMHGAEGGRTLFFLVIDTGTNMVSVHGTPDWPYTYDTLAPAPPAEVSAGPGEGSLVVDFKAPSAAMLDSYHFYCAPADSDCSSTALVPGELPDPATACGSTGAQGSASGTTDSTLQNNTLYAVAVASTDTFGNVGVLSNVACGTPQEVTGFYEAYRAAGGQAGGGFCSFGPARRGGASLAFALLLGAAVLGRRRR